MRATDNAIREDANEGRDSVTGLGPCARCGHDPACGFAQVNDDWLCHTDDHSCYVGSG